MLGEDQPLLQPMAVAPLRHTSAAGLPPEVLPPPLLAVDVACAAASGAAAQADAAAGDRQLLASVRLSTDGQPRAAGKRIAP